MRKATAVIGAGYGDEGKGLMVDALAAAAGAETVARFNGGAQAGHTVMTPGGERHVFHHIGAGAFAGAATHLTRFFVHHPMLLEAEHRAVAGLGGCVSVSADGRGLVTTPWDMLVNQAVEQARGAGRHGSCGLGFGETIERHVQGFGLTVADLVAPDLRQRLRAIRDRWTPRRLAALGVSPAPEHAAALAGDAVLEVFLDDCARFADTVRLRADADLAAHGPVVFEGAQGLMLDQDLGVFPHVTRSHTGLPNVLAVAAEAGIDGVEAVYVTRAYASRHGAGPLDGAGEALEGFEIEDPTNAPNPWQGRIRYAPLDLARLASAVGADLGRASGGAVVVRPALAMTCLDQAVGPVRVLDGAAESSLPASALAGEAGRRLGLPVRAESWGPGRAAVRLADEAAQAA